MKLHDTNIAGLSRVPPHLDLLDFTRCVELRYRWEQSVELTLRLARDDGVLELLVTGVRSVRFSEMAPWFWISELTIESVHDEGIGFRLVEGDGDGFVAYCQHIECVSFTASA